MTRWKPNQTAPIAYEDEHIIVYKDGTWTPRAGDTLGWQMHGDAHVYGNGSDNVTISTAWGHSKLSHVTGPTGIEYDVRALAGS